MKVRIGSSPRELVTTWREPAREWGWASIDRKFDHIPPGYVMTVDSTTCARKRAGESNGAVVTVTVVIFHADQSFPRLSADQLADHWVGILEES